MTATLAVSPGARGRHAARPPMIRSVQAGGGSCATFLAAFQKEAGSVGAEIKRALENARRAGVLPGVVRDALRSNRLEFDGWER